MDIIQKLLKITFEFKSTKVTDEQGFEPTNHATTSIEAMVRLPSQDMSTNKYTHLR